MLNRLLGQVTSRELEFSRGNKVIDGSLPRRKMPRLEACVSEGNVSSAG